MENKFNIILTMHINICQQARRNELKIGAASQR